MNKVRLEDAVDILDSRRIPVSSADRARRDKKYPYYGAQGIVDYIDGYLFDGQYVLVAEDGNNLKSLAEPIVTWAKGRFWVNNHAHILGCNGTADIRFIFYYLMNANLKGLITGSAQPKLNQDNLASYQLFLPQLEKQKAIASLLGAIDDKIALNKKLCAELEETAQLIYDYWFTQFDFPDENGNPYRSSGGKMVYNETLKREIPEGWKANDLSSLVSMSRISVTPSDGAIYEHYSIPAYDNDMVPSFDKGCDIQSSKLSVNRDSLLYSKLNPRFKRLWRPYCITEHAICSTEFVVLEARHQCLTAYCYAILNSPVFYAYTVSKAISSTGSRSRVDPDVVVGFQIPTSPAETIEKKYSSMVSGLLDRAQKLRLEVMDLKNLRDWLLPMLMNGQVKTGNTPEDATEVHV